MNTPSKLTAVELDAQLTQPGAAEDLAATALRATLADLRASSLAAADLRLLAPRPDALRKHSPHTARWVWATATAALALSIALPLALHTAHPAATPTTTAITSSAQLNIDTAAQDDALLADIQNDLSASVPASLEPLATTSTTSTK